MAKKKAKKTGRKRTPSKRRAGAGVRAAGRRGAGARRSAKAKRTTGRRTAGAKTAKRKAARKPIRKVVRRKGGTGSERTLAQTPETGRSVRGPTNPMPTKRSTGTPAGAGSTRRAPSLDRARRQLRELDETVPSPPSSLTLDRTPSAARSGRREMREALDEHKETSPVLTGGDVDADWEDAYAVGDEAPGGDNPTPDQDRVDDIGKALGVEYQDNEELRAADKVADRDRHRWELDPASSEDYRDRD
jgi:hypothetical protein